MWKIWISAESHYYTTMTFYKNGQNNYYTKMKANDSAIWSVVFVFTRGWMCCKRNAVTLSHWREVVLVPHPGNPPGLSLQVTSQEDKMNTVNSSLLFLFFFSAGMASPLHWNISPPQRIITLVCCILLQSSVLRHRLGPLSCHLQWKDSPDLASWFPAHLTIPIHRWPSINLLGFGWKQQITSSITQITQR